MGLSCQICGRTSSVGNQITRSGSPKYKGGIGLHTGGISKRRFYPNIQKIKIVLDGKVGRVNVCTRCIKAGKVMRAPMRPNQIVRSVQKAEARRIALANAEAVRVATLATAEKEAVEAAAAQAAAEAAAEAAYEARNQQREAKKKSAGGAAQDMLDTLEKLDFIESGYTQRPKREDEDDKGKGRGKGKGKGKRR